MANPNKIDYITKDYEGFREDMIDRIPRILPRWTDYTESNAGIVLLELQAYGLDIVSYYQDRTANESFLPTATQRQSVIDNCRMLGYTLDEPLPSTTKVVFEIEEGDEELTIPAGFQIGTERTAQEDSIIFETDEDLTIPAGNTGLETDEDGEYIYTVSATQGITINNDIIGSSNETPNQEFRLTYKDAIQDTIVIEVDEGSGFEVWEDVTDELVQVTENNKHYWREIDERGYTWIIFGDDSNGKVPKKGTDNIRAEYRTGGGAHTNVGSNTITVLKEDLERVSEVKNIEPAEDGADRESIEDAKINAPRYFKTSERCVTAQDYEIQALTIDGVLKAHAESGTEGSNYVDLYLYIDDNFDKDEVFEETYDHIDELKTILAVLNIEEIDKVECEVDADILYDYMEYDSEELHTRVEEQLEGAFDDDNRDLGEGEKLFELYKIIGEVEGLLDIDINKFTIIPEVEGQVEQGEYTWSEVEVTSDNDKDGIWKIEIEDESEGTFSVKFDEDGEFEDSGESHSTGTLDEEYTSDNGEIIFTLTGDSNITEGDYWTFRTSKYEGNIEIEEYELLQLDLDKSNIDFNEEA